MTNSRSASDKSICSSVVDLTHTLKEGIPTWDINCGFRLDTLWDHSKAKDSLSFKTQAISSANGIGTHIDAPAHRFLGGQTVDQIDLASLICSCAVIRVDEPPGENLIIGTNVVELYESKYGRIPPGTFVIFFTGWGKHWNDPQKYRNNLRFPSISPSTAELLLTRDICGIGTDTLSADAGDKAFPVHTLVLGAGKFLVENIANAGSLPDYGAEVAILPMKIEGATEAPLRMVAFI